MGKNTSYVVKKASHFFQSTVSYLRLAHNDGSKKI